jgi:sterol desaturase/sphingolipid hydroxylase (fatty acid hydroxylase superfamily)
MRERVADLLYLALYATGVTSLALPALIRDGLAHVAGRPRVVLPLVIAIILADLCAYWAHRAAHAAPLLWRFHRVHHSSPPGPLAAFRFHLLDLLWMTLARTAPLALVGAAGAPLPLAAFALMLWLEVFAHLGTEWSYGVVGRLVISPRHHGVHHALHDRHFAMLFPIWDRLFGTTAMLAGCNEQPSWQASS